MNHSQSTLSSLSEISTANFQNMLDIYLHSESPSIFSPSDSLSIASLSRNSRRSSPSDSLSIASMSRNSRRIAFQNRWTVNSSALLGTYIQFSSLCTRFPFTLISSIPILTISVSSTISICRNRISYPSIHSEILSLGLLGDAVSTSEASRSYEQVSFRSASVPVIYL